MKDFNLQLASERRRREQMYQELLGAGGPDDVSPQLLNRLGIYRGGRGIWVDKKRTAQLIDDGAIAVSFLHTGSRYPDELSEDGIIFHYPETMRSGIDATEIEALKNAQEYGLPVFVILHSHNSGKRDVERGRVVGHDDNAKQCLILFGAEPHSLPQHNEAPFRLKANRKEKARTVTQRERSPVFQFQVFERYGLQCALCEIAEPRLLEAAHIRPVSKNGSDDPRNGLVLCANHHKAFDAGLVAIRPEDLSIETGPANVYRRSLGITRRTIKNLTNFPHHDALRWRWKAFVK